MAAASLLREWLSTGVLIRDRMPALYLYEQHDASSSWRQRGIIGLVGLGSPRAAGILPHEGVLPGLVADRRELMAATQANLEPIFLIYDGAQPRDPGCPSADVPGRTATEVIDAVAAERAPLVTIDTDDGVTHRLWRIGDPAEQAAITADLCGRRALIADGHHRYAAYMDLQSQARASGRGAGPWDFGLAFLVDSAAYPPRLGAIHRVLPGLAPDRAAELAKAAFTVQDLPAGLDLAGAQRRLAEAGREGTAFLLAGGPGFRLLSHPDPVAAAESMPAGLSAPWRSLDAAVLQQLLLGRLWGITDSERDVLIYHDAADAVRAVTPHVGQRDVPRHRGHLESGHLRGRHRDRGARRTGAAQVHLVRTQAADRAGPAHVRPERGRTGWSGTMIACLNHPRPARRVRSPRTSPRWGTTCSRSTPGWPGTTGSPPGT